MKNQNSRYAVGIDIGTTSISAVALDLETGMPADAVSTPNDTALPPRIPSMREQDARAIAEKAAALLDGLLDRTGGAAAIGLTGQMHGIVTLSASSGR